jgi:hypothetical protein
MTDYKALCARMADELDHYRQLLMDDRRETHALATEARAALAQPAPEGPSDEELTQFLFESFRGPIEFLCDAEEEAHLMIRSHVKFARAVLARWGRPVAEKSSAAQPADGEVAELVRLLRSAADDEINDLTLWLTPSDMRRAAELLERFASPACLVINSSPETINALRVASPGPIKLLPDDAQIIEAAERMVLVPTPQPVPVSERLPGPEDCDAEGRCWIYMPDIGTAPSWRLVDPRDIGPYHTHWLPAHALPVPANDC